MKKSWFTTVNGERRIEKKLMGMNENVIKNINILVF